MRSFCEPRSLPATVVIAAALLTAATACSDTGASADEEPSGETDEVDIGTTGTTSSEADESSDDGGGAVVGSCSYTSVFSQSDECREYIGSGWTEADVQSGCDQLSGQAQLGQPCSDQEVLGRCINDAGTDREVHTVIYGSDASACESSATGCEVFASGTWEGEGVCADADNGGGGGGVSTPFIQPTLECRDPLPGEPPGQGDNGQVCTWQMISGATEQGRRFEDYADCGVVYTQRPYYPVPPNDALPTEDPRLEDPTYAAELDWVRTQIQATACVCCHSNVASDGPGTWDIDAPGNWMNTFFDSGLAFGAGWIDSTSFGAYPAEDNNGFDRSIGVPSTDPARMQAFFVAELAHRGLTEADFVDEPPFGGPLNDQLLYRPSACENDERVDSDGAVHWNGGSARYVYVLEADATSPTVPPNLDFPQGTVWRIDVPSDGEPVESGTVNYGQPRSGMTQRFPASGAPVPLVPGQQYYLYVARDVVQPITRCVFTYEEL